MYWTGVGSETKKFNGRLKARKLLMKIEILPGKNFVRQECSLGKYFPSIQSVLNCSSLMDNFQSSFYDVFRSKLANIVLTLIS